MVLFLCLAGIGYGCDGPKSVIVNQEVIDATGTNQLLLNYVRTDLGFFSKTHDYDFHSIVWRTKTGTSWQNKIIISRAEFERGASNSRWISEIGSLDAATGNAIIKVAAGDAPVGAPTVNYVYSWREWNLTTNREIRIIRICKDPFEKE